MWLAETHVMELAWSSGSRNESNVERGRCRQACQGNGQGNAKKLVKKKNQTSKEILFP